MDRVLFVVAHPDDAELMFGGTIYEYTKTGNEVYFLVVTDGSSWCRDEYKGTKELINRRKEECINSARCLGVKDVIFTGYTDSQISEELIYSRLVKEIKKINPNIIVTHGENEHHHDHIVVNETLKRICNTIDEPAPIKNYLFDHRIPVENFKGLVVHWNLDDGFDSNVRFVRLTQEHYEMKMKALSCYKSQFPGESLEKLKEQQKLFMRFAGNKCYCEYAETYKVINKYNVTDSRFVMEE